MPDPRFFSADGPFKLAEIAARIGAALGEGADGEFVLDDVAPLDQAGPQHLSFLHNPKYVEAFARATAGAVIVHPDQAPLAPAGVAVLTAANPYFAFARASRMFHPPAAPVPGIHPTAVVEAGVKLGKDVAIGPHAVVEAGAEIGDHVALGANCFVGRGCVIGDHSSVGVNASVSHSLIGCRVAIYAGARIGQDGFGFASGREGHLRIPQLGRVVIGDDVEVGANTTIDRGAGPDTVIGAGSMIDNLVQIGHNVTLGRGCVLAAQVGISGSTRIGDFVQIGGQAGLTGHIEIGTGAKIGAQSGVMRDVPPGGTVGGSPAVPMMQWMRQNALLNRMARKKE